MATIYEICKIDVHQNVHGGPTIDDLLKKLGEYIGKFIILEQRARFYVQTRLRIDEPQADIFQSRFEAEMVAKSLGSRMFSNWGPYHVHELTPGFLVDYHRIREEAELIDPIME